MIKNQQQLSEFSYAEQIQHFKNRFLQGTTHSTPLGRIKIKSKNVAVVVVLIRYLWCVQNILGIWTLVTKCICIMSFQNSAILDINRGCNYYLFYTNILEYFLRYKCLIYKATYWYELYIYIYKTLFFHKLALFSKNF